MGYRRPWHLRSPTRQSPPAPTLSFSLAGASLGTRRAIGSRRSRNSSKRWNEREVLPGNSQDDPRAHGSRWPAKPSVNLSPLASPDPRRHRRKTALSPYRGRGPEVALASRTASRSPLTASSGWTGFTATSPTPSGGPPSDVYKPAISPDKVALTRWRWVFGTSHNSPSGLDSRLALLSL